MSVIMVVWLSSASAQKQANKNVPANVSAAFAKLYPNVKDAKWHKEEGYYEAKFMEDGKEMAVHLDRTGELLQREYYIKATELPQNVQNYLNEHYPKANYSEASKMVNPKGVIHYEVEVKEKELLFDQEGTFLKEEKEDKD